MVDMGAVTMGITTISAIAKALLSTDDTTTIHPCKRSGPATTVVAARATEHDTFFLTRHDAPSACVFPEDSLKYSCKFGSIGGRPTAKRWPLTRPDRSGQIPARFLPFFRDASF